ncbi:hypothetical protein HNQ08_003659 [Deinococcus humi]|uniref:Uncharacterized protein n=1 Tax=Deinococcus humi TaxID=662880 RepID=A0A7W8NFK8_9DEIO|nr:hypothetical protein [Deinococcus humi]
MSANVATLHGREQSMSAPGSFQDQSVQGNKEHR